MVAAFPDLQTTVARYTRIAHHSQDSQPSSLAGQRHKREDRDKRRRVSESNSASSVHIEYRILCPDTKIGNVIGKGDSIMKSSETIVTPRSRSKM
ncbi:hypothetical protein GOP47_0030788 [Adiantum capillus-veneris]|nr:hypothetical protein GOP47_0030788 [Adiantum capillus-veneris]